MKRRLTDWTEVPSLFPDMELWGTMYGNWSFVVSSDQDGWGASVKFMSKNATGHTQHLTKGGELDNKDDAVSLCEDWLNTKIKSTN